MNSFFLTSNTSALFIEKNYTPATSAEKKGVSYRGRDINYSDKFNWNNLAVTVVNYHRGLSKIIPTVIDFAKTKLQIFHPARLVEFSLHKRGRVGGIFSYNVYI